MRQTFEVVIIAPPLVVALDIEDDFLDRIVLGFVGKDGICQKKTGREPLDCFQNISDINICIGLEWRNLGQGDARVLVLAPGEVLSEDTDEHIHSRRWKKGELDVVWVSRWDISGSGHAMACK